MIGRTFRRPESARTTGLAQMATETITAPSQERTAQVRINLQTRSEDIRLPNTGPILVSTGKP